QTLYAGKGSAIHLEVKALGSAPFSYQWSKDAVDIPGATSSTYESKEPSIASIGNYSVRVGNAVGLVSSAPAAVLIVNPLRITRPPASVGTVPGARVDLSVEVAGVPPFKYQWRLNGRNIPDA